jgi:ribosomal 30S subunit maturation factor RimM
MTSLTTFYLSGIIGKEVFDADGEAIGRLKDLLVSAVPSGQADPDQQLVIGVRLKIRKKTGFIPQCVQDIKSS